ncbi:CbtB domain-containing protein [Amycolatopsis pittospori]|uniref:CbtB domain-containing protein n=1 Tax=Amycolatopsis pittospori TaxID=2749434 RepID=UPI0015F03412|nr:CbtB-domain containing protein [Amycolatopsis pittospori]
MSSQAVTAVPVPIRIPVREILPWAVLVILLSLITLYFISAEQGAVSVFANSYVHEFVHDGRHLLAFPCH